ncbi:MAG: dihydrodipicolinate synthase family protein [Chloroflexi bacterium]|nr:dihydrodipicolinate synthase family protein [Chloroflexota bacterium]
MVKQMDAMRFDGIHFMMPTPFGPDGSVDTGSIARLVETAAGAGCTGVVTLGVMGEAHRLNDAERAPIIDAVVAACDSRLTVTVGISGQSGAKAAARVREAQSIGAFAAMASPPNLAKPNDNAVFAYYQAIADATEIPIVVQDLPEQTGVHMSPDFIAKLNSQLGNAKYLKLEDPPTPPKISTVRAATKDNIGIFGGLGGAFLFEELQRGAVGTMTGFAYPEALVKIHRQFAGGDVEGARQTFYGWLPLIRYENTAGLSLSIRKHIMANRGMLDSPAVRPPTPAIDALSVAELDDIMGAMSSFIAREIGGAAVAA